MTTTRDYATCNGETVLGPPCTNPKDTCPHKAAHQRLAADRARARAATSAPRTPGAVAPVSVAVQSTALGLSEVPTTAGAWRAARDEQASRVAALYAQPKGTDTRGVPTTLEGRRATHEGLPRRVALQWVTDGFVGSPTDLRDAAAAIADLQDVALGVALDKIAKGYTGPPGELAPLAEATVKHPASHVAP